MFSDQSLLIKGSGKMKLIETVEPKSKIKDYQSDTRNENVADDTVRFLQRIESNFKRKSKGKIFYIFTT